MKKNRRLPIFLAVIMILTVLLAGCSNAQQGQPTAAFAQSASAAGQTTASATASVSASPTPASSSTPAAAIKKDQLKSLEQPLTGLLLAVEETGGEYPGKDAAVDPQFAGYYLYYIANNFYDKNIKTYAEFKDPAFKQFIAFTGADADKLLAAAFGKRFASTNLPAFDPKSKGNVAFTDKGTVYVGADLGGPSSVTYAGGDVTLQNGKADVQYQYNYVPMTHGLEYNGTLTATVSQASGGTLVITELVIPQPEDTASAS